MKESVETTPFIVIYSDGENPYDFSPLTSIFLPPEYCDVDQILVFIY